MSDDLIAWLRAQLDEDERNASLGVVDGDGVWWCRRCDGGFTDVHRLDDHLFAEHAVREWGPARVLAEVDAKRQVLAACVADLTERGDGALDGRVDRPTWDILLLLALPYSDRPDYREEWRP